MSPNRLILNITPGQGSSLEFEARQPGPAMDLAAVRMDFHYDDWFPKEPSVGYETLLYDVMTGDQTRFTRADMIEHIRGSCSRCSTPGRKRRSFPTTRREATAREQPANC